MITQLQRPVIGTYLSLAADADTVAALEDLADRVIGRVDAVASRFRTDSDLTRANERAGQWTTVDPLLVELVEVALLCAENSEGLVDPLLGDRLVRLGYDRDYAELTPLPADVRACGGDSAAYQPGWRQVRTEPGQVWLPEGYALDLGSSAKAWIADEVAREMRRTHPGAEWIVSVGGEVQASGTWPVDISVRRDAPPVQRIELTDGALATSSTSSRGWLDQGVPRHHVIDPHTGYPSTSPWSSVSVAAPTCVEANTLALAALLRGDAGPDWLAAYERPGLFVAHDGTLRTCGAWPEVDDE